MRLVVRYLAVYRLMSSIPLHRDDRRFCGVKAILLAIVIAVAALALAGCGGGSGKSASTDAAVTELDPKLVADYPQVYESVKAKTDCTELRQLLARAVKGAGEQLRKPVTDTEELRFYTAFMNATTARLPELDCSFAGPGTESTSTTDEEATALSPEEQCVEHWNRSSSNSSNRLYLSALIDKTRYVSVTFEATFGRCLITAANPNKGVDAAGTALQFLQRGRRFVATSTDPSKPASPLFRAFSPDLLDASETDWNASADENGYLTYTG